jgi:hypothetical protein
MKQMLACRRLSESWPSMLLRVPVGVLLYFAQYSLAQGPPGGLILYVFFRLIPTRYCIILLSMSVSVLLSIKGSHAPR